MNALPDAYCYFQDIEPQPPLKLKFDRDYLLHAVKGALNVRIGGEEVAFAPFLRGMGAREHGNRRRNQTPGDELLDPVRVRILQAISQPSCSLSDVRSNPRNGSALP